MTDVAAPAAPAEGAWRRRLAAAVVALVALVAPAACSPTSPVTSASEAGGLSRAGMAGAQATQPADRVDLTLYFRSGGGAGAHLLPVVREVAVSDDLPRTALELLLAGPRPEDGAGLVAPLPTSTRLLAFRMAGDAAYVDLSGAVVDDAASVASRPVHEALALAALADTLTEFPTVQRVHVTVDGRSSGRFWGAWGLPRWLLRDDSVIGPPADGRAVPDIASFSHRPQRIGADVAAPAVRVRGVSARVHTGYLRVSVELAGAGDAAGAVPSSRARRRGRAVELLVDRAVAATLPSDGVLPVADPTFDAVQVEPGLLPGTVRVVVRSRERTAFFLHTIPNPTRVVLDVRTSR